MADAGVEDVVGGEAWLLDFEENEVGVGRVGFVGWDFLLCLEQSGTFGEDEFSGAVDVVFVLEHEFAGEGSEAV